MTEPDWLAETRASYDLVAENYADLLAGELDKSPHDRAMLAWFAALVPPGSTVADVGCGPGRITGHLVSLGLDAFGVDLSPRMVEEARRRHPGLQFETGNIERLDLGDGALGGILAWYSLIHLPPDRLAPAFAELRRVLAPGGQLLTAFQVGDVPLRLEQAYGHEVALDTWRRDPDEMTELLGTAGFDVHAKVVREATAPEKAPRAYLFARAQ